MFQAHVIIYFDIFKTFARGVRSVRSFYCLLFPVDMIEVQRFQISLLVEHIIPHIAGVLPQHMRLYNLCRACRFPLKLYVYSLFLVAVQLSEQLLKFLCIHRHSCLLFLPGRNFFRPPHKMEYDKNNGRPVSSWKCVIYQDRPSHRNRILNSRAAVLRTCSC